MSTLFRQALAGLRLLIVMTLLLGVLYPLAVYAVAHLPGLSEKAEGSVITVNGAAVGSSLIGVDPVPANPAADPYFHTRPSATATDVLGPGDPSLSGASNRSGFNTDQLEAVDQRRDLIAARESVAPAMVPVDAVTASASGLDPHIGSEYARLQVARVARVTGLDPARVAALVAEHTDGRFLGLFGEPGVNVPELNVAVAAALRTNTGDEG